MRYEVTHKTKYVYQSPASLCHNVVYQWPISYPFQQVDAGCWLLVDDCCRGVLKKDSQKKIPTTTIDALLQSTREKTPYLYQLQSSLWSDMTILKVQEGTSSSR